MSMQAHLAELERKHQALETELADALAHPSVDDMTIAELKRRKLQVKDEIARLKQTNSERTLGRPDRSAPRHRPRSGVACLFQRSRRFLEEAGGFAFGSGCGLLMSALIAKRVLLSAAWSRAQRRGAPRRTIRRARSRWWCPMRRAAATT